MYLSSLFKTNTIKIWTTIHAYFTFLSWIFQCLQAWALDERKKSWEREREKKNAHIYLLDFFPIKNSKFDTCIPITHLTLHCNAQMCEWKMLQNRRRKKIHTHNNTPFEMKWMTMACVVRFIYHHFAVALITQCPSFVHSLFFFSSSFIFALLSCVAFSKTVTIIYLR